jgi:hypothetical protein
LHRQAECLGLAVFVISHKAYKSGLVHVLGFAPAGTLKDSGGPFQARPQLVSLSHGPVACNFIFGWIRQTMTSAAGKESAAIENSDTATTAPRWAYEPRPVAPKVTGGPLNLHWVADILPVAAIFAAAVI